MVPENRVQDGSFPIPKLLIGKEDISQFIEEFRGFHAQFADCFSREEPRENFFQYMAGQMSQLERKSIEPIAVNVEDAKVRAMQHFVSDVIWVRIPLIPPPDSERIRHPVPIQVARVIRLIPPPLVGAKRRWFFSSFS